MAGGLKMEAGRFEEASPMSMQALSAAIKEEEEED
jgi:hypothetical protein